MQFAVLGPIAITASRDVNLGGPRQRRLLAALVLSVGHVVSADRLADIVFEGEPTDASLVTLRSYVARLRRAIGDLGPEIVTRPPGYMLEIGDSTVDAVVFESEVTQAGRDLSGGSPHLALERFTDALALWRGQAYAEFADEEWVRAEAMRLNELRLLAEEGRFQSLIEVGRHGEAVTGLASFVEQHELRETPRLLHMLALYRAGRQPDALRAGAAFRDTLADLGLEPTAELAALEERIILHDPALRLPPPTGRALRGYRIHERIGGGDDTEVRTATQPGVERLVVIKSFSEGVSDHPTFIRDFEERVRAVARVEHPGLVDTVDFWREPGNAHLVTRLVRGGSLDDLFDKGPLATQQVSSIITQVADALATVHRAGLYHGHLRPGDILFDDEGTVKVADVGTAEILAAIRAETDDTAHPPDESIEPGASRDQLAMATLAYQALTGLAPLLHGNGSFPRVSDLRPELLALDGVLARAGAAHHEDRYPDITAFANAFANALGTSQAGSATTVRQPNPYKGLRAFTEADATEFFGREIVVTEVTTRLSSDRPGIVTLVGASGSGKSSIVRAGVIPRLRRGAVPGSADWIIATMIPGPAPATELTRALRRVAPLDEGHRLDAEVDGIAPAVERVCGDQHLLLVIDQLEELYTLVTDDVVRDRFVDGLLEIVSDPDIPVTILATLRADFLDRPLQHHRLGQLVSAGAVPVVGMAPAEIERAIVEPAAAVGVEIERAVAAELVADVVDQPAALPLLQFALTELFDHRTSNRITVEDHARLGGVAGAISGRAERLYTGATPEERNQLRVMFLRLMIVTEGATDLRRRTDRSEILSAASDPTGMNRLIDRFGDARLLTFDRNPVTREPTVEVAHEALLRHWPRLQAWVRAEGEGLRHRAHLTAAAAAWEAANRDPGELYRGTRLGTAEEWAVGADTTESEQAFLEASLELRTAEEIAEQRTLEREIATNRRLRRALATTAVVLVVALLAGFAAAEQRNRARAETALAEQARGRTLAAASVDQLPADRSLALLLAIEASRLDDSSVTHSALLGALGGDGLPFTRTVIPTPAADYMALAVSADGSIAAAKRSDGSIDIVDLDDRSLLQVGLTGPSVPLGGVDISPDGSVVAVSGRTTDGAAVVIYDTMVGDELAVIGGEDGLNHQVAFTPDGRSLVVASASGRISVHDPVTGALTREVGTAPGMEVVAMTFLSDSLYVLTVAGVDDVAPQISAWDVQGATMTGGPLALDDLSAVSLSAHGDGTLLVGGVDLTVVDGASLRVEEVVAGVTDGSIALFSVDSSVDGLVAAASVVGIDLWAGLGSGMGLSPLPVQGQAAAVAFSPDGSTLVTADADGSVSTWRAGWIDDLGVPIEPVGPGVVTVSPDGSHLVVWARGRGAQVFDPDTLDHLGQLGDLDADDSFLGLDFSPDGSSVVTLTCPQGPQPVCPATLQLFDVATGEQIAGPVDAGDNWAFALRAVAFASDGRSIASGGFRDGVRLWDASTLQPRDTVLAPDDVTPEPGLEVRVVATGERSGRSIVAAVSEVGQVAVWDVTDSVRVIGAIEVPTNHVWFTPDGLLVTSHFAGPFQFRDPLTLEPVGPPFPSEWAANGFSMTDGGLLVMSSATGGSQLWDVATRRPLSGLLPSFTSSLHPSGDTLFLGAIGFDEGGRDVRVVPLDDASLLEDACRRAGRNLTFEEWTVYMPSDEEYRPTCPRWAVDLSGGD